MEYQVSVIGFAILIALMAFGAPIAIAMGAVGFFGFAYIVGFGPATSMVGQVVSDNILNYDFSLLPLFIFMGNLISQSRLSADLFSAANAFVGHWRGGLAHATVVSCGAFSAVSGSSMATTITMSKVAIPQMRKFGYSDRLACASVAAGGTLGILIPPSVVLIIYGFLTNTDIAQLFIAGILPGILGIALYSLAVAAVTQVDRAAGPAGEKVAWPARWGSLKGVWPVLVLFFGILGGIYGGVFTPNEAAGVGAAGALVFALLRRTLTWSSLLSISIDTVRTTSMMFFLLFGALLFSNFIAVSGGAAALEQWIVGLDVSPVLILIIIVGVYLLLGMLLESLSMILLTVPLFFPVASALGIDPIWFGIVVVVATEIGLITPPVGLNVFVLRAVFPDISITEVFKGILPFFMADILRISLLIAIPSIALFLPSLMS